MIKLNKLTYCIFFVALLFITSCGSSQKKLTSSTAIREVEIIENTWMNALVKKDTAALANILSPTFSLSGSHQQKETREQYLGTSAMAERTLKPIILEDRAFEYFPNTVISTGIASYKGEYKINGFNLRVRYTNIYILSNNRWKVVAAHINAVEN